jgi:molybdopterin-guanine dinucleotide biosynthesis protein A
MGQDKALLEKDGVTMLRRTWEIARSLSPDVWVMTPWRDRYQSLLSETAQWIPEALPEPGERPAGPLMAFAQALAQLEADWVLLLACDLPQLRADVLNQWVQELPRVQADQIAYLPRRDERWEPLCGFYRTSCLPSLQRYLATGERSFQSWLDQHPVEVIPDAPASLLTNCNTPEEWKRCLETSSALSYDAKL